MATRKKAKSGADPLVPIYSPHLRAAIQEQGLSVAGAARRLRESQQTLAHLTVGDGIKRCRRSRFLKLTRMLEVSEDFLSGPSVQVMPLYPPSGEAIVTGVLSFDSPRAQLALSRLLRRCVEASDRDLADPTLGKAGKPSSADEVIRGNLARCVRALVSIDDWRQAIMVGVEAPFWGFVFDGTMIRSRSLPTDPDEEAGRLALMGGWERILEPWFAGRARMNYRSLRVRAGFRSDRGSDLLDTDPRVLHGLDEPQVQPPTQEGRAK